MTGNYTTETFDQEHRYFGGIIYNSDFSTEHGGQNIAKRIESDMRWERSLQKIQKYNIKRKYLEV